MTLATRLDTAVERVREERQAVAGERDALDTFVARVEEVPLVDGQQPLADGGPAAAFPGTGPTGPGAGAGPSAAGSTGASDGLDAVREAFAECVVPAVPDGLTGDSPAAVMRDTFGADVAGVLAGAGPLTAPVQAGLLDAVAERRRELDTTEATLDREREQLADAHATVEAVESWLRTVDGTPLTELGFDALRARHERLASFRDRCDDLARDRQAFRRGTTARDGCRVSHEPFLAYLYGDFGGPDGDGGDDSEPGYPVLGAVAELATVCVDCQRAVRNHLTARA